MMMENAISDQSVNAILQRIDALAAKLGITAQYIFSVYVQQAKVVGIQCCILGVMMLLISASLLYGARSFFRYGIRQASSDDWPFICGAVSGMVALALIISTLVILNEAIGAILNPQFWALTEMFKALGGSH